MEGGDAGRPVALSVEERELARRWRLARRQAGDGLWLLAGVATLMALTPFWEGGRFPDELIAFVRTMVIASSACLVLWGIESFVLVPRRLRALREGRTRRYRD
jgi:hypothetical protein